MSIYKSFRNYRNEPAQFNSMSPRFDQPTYLSFKLEFAPQRDIMYNRAAGGSKTPINYDTMPHPLFAEKSELNVADRETYAAVDYLLDANEFTKARMLEEWINQFNTFQTDYQWYFQSIEGISDLLKINPLSGQRVRSDTRLTINTLEAVDLRMSHLLSMYKKIVWDDTYQRWILPDMMRYFSLKIYIAEFREFQAAAPFNGLGESTVQKVFGEDDLELHRLDDILPTWVINCEMCEFDLENLNYTYLDNLNVGEDPEQAGLSFGIKVGKMYEEQVYPTFKNAYLFDKKLNGFSRAIDKEGSESQRSVQNEAGETINVTEGSSVDYDSTSTLNAGLPSNAPQLYNMVAQSNKLDAEVHVSGQPFNQMANSSNLFGAKGTESSSETWVGNAAKFGVAFAENFVEEKIDKAKITSIPGLGVSFTDVTSALESKNIISALGMIRKGVNTVAAGYVQPSELLEGDIVNAMFRSYLESVVTSEATEDNQLIQEAANLALNDNGVWGQIADYSKATDLVGTNNGEINAPNDIKGANNYRDVTSEATQMDNSLATDLVGPGESNVPKHITSNNIFEGIPTSQATSSSIQK